MERVQSLHTHTMHVNDSKGRESDCRLLRAQTRKEFAVVYRLS